VPLSLALGTFGLLCVAAFAFWPTYLSKPLGPVDGYTHLHAAVGLLWLVLLAAQALLILRNDRIAHRTLGRMSYALAPLFALSSVFLAHYRFSRMEPATFAREAYTLYLPLSAATLFALAYCLAIRYRPLPPVHARFMACTALLLVDPVVGRFLAFHVAELPQFWHYQIITFGAELGVLFLLWRTIPRGTPGRGVFLGFSAIYASGLLLWFAVPASNAWLSFARWFRELPLT
jgi:hypothetical protein